MRLPNEKQVATVRIEGEFPAELNVYDFEFEPGWKIDFKKDDNGKITILDVEGILAKTDEVSTTTIDEPFLLCPLKIFLID